MPRFLRSVAALFVLAAAYAFAPVSVSPVSAGEADGLGPDIPKAAQGTQCIRDTEFMRRNHMYLLKHKRDLTVHDGDRTQDASLKECIACHAVNGDDGQPVPVSDSRHFCRACHDYAAVKVDCFDCHASRPDPKGSASLSPSDASDLAALSNFVGGKDQ